MSAADSARHIDAKRDADAPGKGDVREAAVHNLACLAMAE